MLNRESNILVIFDSKSSFEHGHGSENVATAAVFLFTVFAEVLFPGEGFWKVRNVIDLEVKRIAGTARFGLSFSFRLEFRSVTSFLIELS